jgi:Acetyltransferases, including N-acetylases of ribosomal proteins
MTELEHFGVKGMKWGVRKAEYRESVANAAPVGSKTRVVAPNGDVLTIHRADPGPLAIAAGRLVGRKPEGYAYEMRIHNTAGEQVGAFQVWHDGPHAVRGEWLEIAPSHQGKAYSETAIRGLIEASKKKTDITEVRLQVPSNAAPAKHIYSKIGFKKDKDLGFAPGYGNLEDWVYELTKDGR